MRGAVVDARDGDRAPPPSLQVARGDDGLERGAAVRAARERRSADRAALAIAPAARRRGRPPSAVEDGRPTVRSAVIRGGVVAPAYWKDAVRRSSDRAPSRAARRLIGGGEVSGGSSARLRLRLATRTRRHGGASNAGREAGDRRRPRRRLRSRARAAAPRLTQRSRAAPAHRERDGEPGADRRGARRRRGRSQLSGLAAFCRRCRPASTATSPKPLSGEKAERPRRGAARPPRRRAPTSRRDAPRCDLLARRARSIGARRRHLPRASMRLRLSPNPTRQPIASSRRLAALRARRRWHARARRATRHRAA